LVLTAPGQREPRHLEPVDPAPWPQHILRAEDWLVYRFPQGIEKWATVDSRLSALCRRGAFRQQKSFALYAFSPDASYGVGFAEGANLHDPQKLAKPGRVYFFFDSETSRCLVMTAERGAIATFATPRVSFLFGGSQPAR
jgi:hypothetical protein